MKPCRIVPSSGIRDRSTAYSSPFFDVADTLPLGDAICVAGTCWNTMGHAIPVNGSLLELQDRQYFADLFHVFLFGTISKYHHKAYDHPGRVPSMTQVLLLLTSSPLTPNDSLGITSSPKKHSYRVWKYFLFV